MAYIRCAVAVIAGMAFSVFVFAAEQRRIEEIVVTAEKRQSTVSDTSISITAFGEQMLEDFGIQGADELVNYIPSTTRDAFDIRIRGVGRNFRALGGDPGVATYYNGVYSEDFGIAASENGLYDVARVEVLRGPQGTLYGRNSIGGALNYISNAPSYEQEAELRYLVGNIGTQEYYGVLSGPIIDDTLAYRLVGVMRDRDGAQDGIDGSEDVNSIDDQNFSLALNWKIADNWESNVRWNARSSDRIIGENSLLSEGPDGIRLSDGASLRGMRSVDVYALGLVSQRPALFFGAGNSQPVTALSSDAIQFTDPITGMPVFAAYARPGVDRAASTRPNAAFGTNPNVFDPDIDDLNGTALTNDLNDEVFDHQGVQFDLTWDINDTTSLKYIGGWSDFDYTFDIDSDDSTSDLTVFRSVVLEAVETYSHELQLLWQIGDSLQLTSGLYYFKSKRLQDFSFNDLENQGRITNAANYTHPNPLGFGPCCGLDMEPFIAFFGSHKRLGDAAPRTAVFGRWDGDPEGQSYHYRNTVETDAYAAFTQGTYTFTEEWALTLGIRYAQDEKEAFENRTGYFEDNMEPGASFLGAAFRALAADPICAGFYGAFGAPAIPFLPPVTDCAAAGHTYTSVMNVAMGNANFNFDPATIGASPIIPTCVLDDRDCTTPLRLQGLPMSFADSTEGDDTWSKVTWRINLDWTPTDDTLVYLSATAGYRAGGYSLGIGDSRGINFDDIVANGFADVSTPFTYEDENVISYEIGYKQSLLDDQLQLFTSFYFYDYDDYQDRINFFNPISGVGQDVTRNIEEARNMGWEIELTWLATDSLTIGGNYSWADATYESDFFVVVDDDPARPVIRFDTPNTCPPGVLPDCTVPNLLILPEVVNLNGNDLKRIPQHKGTLWAFYDWTFARGTLTAGGTISYTGEFEDGDGLGRKLEEIPDRQRIDLSLTWRSNADTWSIRAFVDNVTDEGASRGVSTGTGGSNWRYSTNYLYPRFAGVDIRYRFAG